METMTTSIILPFLVFFPFLGAVISYIIGRSNKGARDIWCWILSAVIFIASLTLIGKETVYSLRGFCGLGLSFAADGFGVILAVLTGAIWLITTIFSKEYMAAERNRNRYYFFVFLTLGATMGIFLSADLFTTFIFFEIMSFTSFVLVMHDEEDFTVRSAKTYLAVAVIGGLVTLMGLFMMYQKACRFHDEKIANDILHTDDVARRIDSVWLCGEGRAVSAAYLAAECVYRCTGTLQCAAQLSADKNRRIRYDYRQLQAFPA